MRDDNALGYLLDDYDHVISCKILRVYLCCLEGQLLIADIKDIQSRLYWPEAVCKGLEGPGKLRFNYSFILMSYFVLPHFDHSVNVFGCQYCP